MNQVKEYTPDQITDAEKLCKLMRNFSEPKRLLFRVSAMAYLNGIEAGIALERDAGKKT